MRFIKFIFICIILFAAVLFAVSYFIPSSVRVSRAINLANDKDSVLHYINDLSKWPQWYEGFDKAQLSNIQSKDGKVQSLTANYIQLKVVADSDSLVTVEMKKSDKPVFTSYKLIRHSSSDSLTLQNYIDFEFSWYPWEKFTSLFLDKSYGATMEKNLDKLKSLP